METTTPIDRTRKMFITFGQKHVHSINGKTLDKDTVAVIPAKTYTEGREKAFEYFNGVFCFSYFESEWTPSDIEWFPKGYVEL